MPRLNTKPGMILALSACVLLATSCSEVREALIPGKQAPDEFAVYARAPLSLPPDYNLRVPTPGAERPQDIDPEDVAQELTVGITQEPEKPSSALEDLLQQTGADSAEPDIRTLVDHESSPFAEEEDAIISRILFWQEPPGQTGVQINAEEEARRIREKQALGEPVTGGEAPVIRKKTRGLLEGLF